MNFFNTITLVPIAGGGTYAVDIDSGVQHVYIKPAAAITLAADVNITVSGTPKLNQYIKFVYAGTIDSDTAAGITVNVFGTALTNEQALYEAEIRAFYNGSAWEMHICSDEQAGNVPINGGTIGAGTIGTEQLADESITLAKTADITRGSIAVGETSDRPIALDAKTTGYVLVGNGTDLVSVAMSGDATISGTGVVTIGDGKITDAMLVNTPTTYYQYTGSLTSTTITDLYAGGGSVALNIIPAQGAGKIIDVISVKSWLDYGTAAYTAGGVLQLDYTGSAGTAIASVAATAVTGSVDTTATWDIPTAVNTAGINAGVYLNNLSAAFATGDGVLNLSVLYRIIDFN